MANDVADDARKVVTEIDKNLKETYEDVVVITHQRPGVGDKRPRGPARNVREQVETRRPNPDKRCTITRAQLTALVQHLHVSVLTRASKEDL
jgi:hypothetical protein